MKSISYLRKNHPRFIYQKYSYSIERGTLKASFDFKVEPGIKFKSKIRIRGVPENRLGQMDKKALNNFVFHLGMMEIPTYWKATCSPEIVIRAGFLTKAQTDWWKALILKGMSQFFYENKIDSRADDFLSVLNNPSVEAPPLGVSSMELKGRYLIPMGGGKDSIVTLEKIKEKGESVNCFLLNPGRTQKKVLKTAGIKSPVVAERDIDLLLLRLNREGYLNGHTPFTAVLHFLGVFCAVLFDYKNVAFSNEKSADEGNAVYLGKEVNHQYAKSSEFEKGFKNYCQKYLTKNARCFSFLRKYTELQISRMFTGYPKYFSAFSSCNVGLKTGERWCGNCPKCLFVYASLYPYLDKKELMKIFGKDIFENKNFLPVMKGLIGRGKHKPLECVGTYKESCSAFDMGLAKAKKEGEIPYLLKKYDEIKRTGK
jgi:UDP-N-acetyl-alpha-D-muramoyl-L-alanyl-L-glutamate epimerase